MGSSSVTQTTKQILFRSILSRHSLQAGVYLDFLTRGMVAMLGVADQTHFASVLLYATYYILHCNVQY